MLEEVRAAKPMDGVLRQRWFTDEDFDLTIWYRPTGEVHGFQLSYDKRAAPIESVLTWKAHQGFDVTHVDSAFGALTPVLRPGGRPPDQALLQRFRAHAKKIEPELKRLLVTQLRVVLRG